MYAYHFYNASKYVDVSAVKGEHLAEVRGKSFATSTRYMIFINVIICVNAQMLVKYFLIMIFGNFSDVLFPSFKK